MAPSLPKSPFIKSPRAAMPDGITVYPLERLGNQLFIYAAGLAQARRHDAQENHGGQENDGAQEDDGTKESDDKQESDDA